MHYKNIYNFRPSLIMSSRIQQVWKPVWAMQKNRCITFHTVSAQTLTQAIKMHLSRSSQCYIWCNNRRCLVCKQPCKQSCHMRLINTSVFQVFPHLSRGWNTSALCLNILQVRINAAPQEKLAIHFRLYHELFKETVTLDHCNSSALWQNLFTVCMLFRGQEVSTHLSPALC